jgi:hypothetical protein
MTGFSGRGFCGGRDFALPRLAVALVASELTGFVDAPVL